MAPTDHAAVLRFTYPGDDASVIFDNVTEQARPHPRQGQRASSPATRTSSPGLSTGATRLFVYGVVRRAGDRAAAGGGAAGVKGYLRFDAGRGPHGHPAARHLADQPRPGEGQPAPGDPGRHLLRHGREPRPAGVGRLLGKVEVEGATRGPAAPRLYSSLYRLYLYPNSGFEKVGSEVTSTPRPSRRCRARTPRPTPARRSSTARCTSTTASGTPIGRPGRRTRFLTPESGGRDGRRVRAAVQGRRLDLALVLARLRGPDDGHLLGRGVRGRVRQGRRLRREGGVRRGA